MANEVKLTGLDDVLRKLHALPEQVARKGTRAGLRKGGNVIRDLARAGAARIDDPLTPENIAKNIVTRNYKKSDEARLGGPAVRVGVLGGARDNSKFGELKAAGKGNPGGDTWYWRMLEFGHLARDGSPVAARPFMRPAMQQGAEGALQAAADGIEAALDKALSK